MSRSYKKTPVGPFACAGVLGQKKDKVIAHKKFRRKSKMKIADGKDGYFRLREVSDNWNWAADGRLYYSPKRYSKEKWWRNLINK